MHPPGVERDSFQCRGHLPGITVTSTVVIVPGSFTSTMSVPWCTGPPDVGTVPGVRLR